MNYIQGRLVAIWFMRFAVAALILMTIVVINDSAISTCHSLNIPVSICECVECDYVDEVRIENVAPSAAVSADHSITYLYADIKILQLSTFIFQPPEMA